MGRTNPTYRDHLNDVEDALSDFRRGLRRQHQPHFDKLFEQARAFADAAHMANHRDTTLMILLSICLAQEHRIAQLEAERELN